MGNETGGEEGGGGNGANRDPYGPGTMRSKNSTVILDSSYEDETGMDVDANLEALAGVRAAAGKANAANSANPPKRTKKKNQGPAKKIHPLENLSFEVTNKAKEGLSDIKKELDELSPL